jgi:hypothetical protein
MRHVTAIAGRRLWNQHIVRREHQGPGDVVRCLGAVQAQEFEHAKWGLALRMREGITNAALERAFADGEMLRTHVMRPTWHFVTPADIRWMLELTGARVLRAMASYFRQLELTPRLLTRGTSVIERALRGGRHLTRAELGEQLRRAGVSVEGPRLGNLTMYAELEGVICSGPRRGRHSTYALIDERAPKAIRLQRDEALATLTRRYFTSHGPATTRDFAWWSGLTVADARRGLEMNNAAGAEIAGRTYWWLGEPSSTRARAVHLLPIYDEYLVAYRDRDAVPHRPSALPRRPDESVTFQHSLVIRGQVAGSWKLARTQKAVRLHVFPAATLSRADRAALVKVARRYEEFVGVPVELRHE